MKFVLLNDNPNFCNLYFWGQSRFESFKARSARTPRFARYEPNLLYIQDDRLDGVKPQFKSTPTTTQRNKSFYPTRITEPN
jgi:hypothetical protein